MGEPVFEEEHADEQNRRHAFIKSADADDLTKATSAVNREEKERSVRPQVEPRGHPRGHPA